MPTVQQSANDALAKIPYSLASKKLPIRVVTGQLGKDNPYPMRSGSIASTRAGDAFAPVTVENEKQWNNPDYTPQLLTHEMAHGVQNNWPQKIQDALPPVNSSDPYNYGGSQGLKKIGMDPTKLSREASAAVEQTYQAQRQNGNVDPVLKKFDENFGSVPLSVMQPTDPNRQGINTTPRTPGLPAKQVAGMEKLYAKKTIPVTPGSGVTLDMSTYQPVDEPKSDVKLDMSTYQPVDEGPERPGVPAAPLPAGLQSPVTSQDKAAVATGNALSAAGDVGLGALKGGLHTISGSDDWARNHLPSFLTNSNMGFGSPANLDNVKQMATPQNTAQKVGYGGEQVGEFLVPGLGEDSAYARLAPKVGKAAPILKAGLAAVGSGAVNKAQGGDFSTGALAGGVGSGLSQGLSKLAPVIAESALNVTGANRMYGRTVGRAILDDTRGIRPSTIEDSARAKIGELRPQVEQAAQDAAAAGSRGSLIPARAGVAGKMGQHLQNRAVNSSAELAPLQSFLQKDAVSGLPLGASQSPTGLLQLKRGLDSDFIGNWNPTRNTNNELDAAKSAYGSLADQFHAAAPGTKALDQRISSLIPVAERAKRTTLGAGMMQNTLNRFKTPTGALVGMFGGGEEGYRHGGVPGALGGAAIGAALPALIGSPEAQLFMARSLNGLVPKLVVPAAKGAALQLNRKSKTDPPE